MPIIKYKASQTHHHGCWQYASHWQCAVDFINKFREAAEGVLQCESDATFDDAISALQQLLDETDPDGQNGT